MTETQVPAGRPERRTPEQWGELVQDYEASGQSQRAFCAERGIGQSSLRYWKRRLEQKSGPEGAPIAQGPRLVPVKLVEDASVPADSGLAVVMPGGVRVEIARGFDAPTLACVLATLEAA
jgi:transposase-like protein